jgi:hypothetical protein
LRPDTFSFGNNKRRNQLYVIRGFWQLLAATVTVFILLARELGTTWV